MSTLYVDYEGGNDSNNGTSFALRKKTIPSANTAAASGDTIRVMASPDATSMGNATWNNLSKTVTLASPLTANISLCETAWTAATNVTTTTTTTRRQGSFASQMAIAAAFTTGQVARESFAAIDFSAYQQISFFIRTSAAIAVNVFELRLCSDSAGTTTIDTVAIPAIPSTNINLWTSITYDKTSALGSSIQSVVLHALVDPGTVTVRLDNILACKASSSADSITLNSLISKNTATETWFAIQSINGTNLLLDANPDSLPTAGRGYYGLTETITTYKREPIATDLSTAAAVFTMAQGGSDPSYINISGGWNRTNMSTQTGETHYSGRNSSLIGISITTLNFLSFDKISLYRYTVGFNMLGGCAGIMISNCHCNNHSSDSFLISSYNTFLTNVFACSCADTGISLASPNVTLKNVYTDNNIQTGIFAQTSARIFGDVVNIRNNGARGFWNIDVGSVYIQGLISDSNIIAGIFNDGGEIFLLNPNVTDSTPVSLATTYTAAFVRAQKWGSGADDHRTFYDIGNIVSVTDSNRRTASGYAWKFNPTSTAATINYTLKMNVAKIACVANSLVTVKIWVKRSNTGISARLFMLGNQISGASSDIIATASGSANVYEQLSISFTPTEIGVVDIDLQTYGGTSFSAWFDDMTITQL